jgi:hypothetical protein
VTRLGNGRVLVVGGVDEATTELYDPPTGTWIPAGTLHQPRWLHVAVRLVDGRVLVAGGGRYTATAERYDPATNRWTPTGSMNVDRITFTATLLRDGRVLVADSANGEVYSPATGTWTATGPVVYPGLSGRAAVLADGQVLYAGDERFYCGVKLLLRALRQRRAVHPLAQTPRDRIGARLSHAPYDRLPRPRLDQRPPALGYGGGEAGCTSRRRRPPSLRDLPGPACLLRVLARLDPGTVPHQQKLWLHDIPLSDLAEFSINGPARRNGPWSSPSSVESCWIPCQAT